MPSVRWSVTPSGTVDTRRQGTVIDLRDLGGARLRRGAHGLRPSGDLAGVRGPLARGGPGGGRLLAASGQLEVADEDDEDPQARRRARAATEAEPPADRRRLPQPVGDGRPERPGDDV